MSSFEETGPDKIIGDYELLLLSFTSILDNSINHSGNGGRIMIKSEDNEEDIIYCITDEGSGFTEEAFKGLFKMFSPGEPFIDSNKGLSLSLVNLVMDAHEGKIEVSNNEDKGATVKLIFNKKI